MKRIDQEVFDDFMHLLHRTKAATVQLAEEEGMTLMQLNVMYSVFHSNEGIVMGQLAELLHCDASNITGIVDRLAAQGLVIRNESERDRRVKKIVMTEKGKRAVTELMAALPAKLGCDRLTAQERMSLHTIIQKLGE